MLVAFTWYVDPGAQERTQWFDMPQVPAVGDSISLGDPYVPTMMVQRVTWVADDVPEGRIAGRRDADRLQPYL